MVKKVETEIQRAARALIAGHASLRAAARATGISAATLSRLRSGVIANPGKRAQQILGLQRVTSYQSVNGRTCGQSRT